MVDPMRTWGQA
jgi:hypothetical protein